MNHYFGSLFLDNSAICVRSNTTFRAMVAKDFPEIQHQFDPWHWIKVNRFNLASFLNDQNCNSTQNLLSEYPVTYLEIQRQTFGALETGYCQAPLVGPNHISRWTQMCPLKDFRNWKSQMCPPPALLYNNFWRGTFWHAKMGDIHLLGSISAGGVGHKNIWGSLEPKVVVNILAVATLNRQKTWPVPHIRWPWAREGQDRVPVLSHQRYSPVSTFVQVRSWGLLSNDCWILTQS